MLCVCIIWMGKKRHQPTDKAFLGVKEEKEILAMSNEYACNASINANPNQIDQCLPNIR